MNLWILYKFGYVISQFIAEMLQNRLEDYIDVFVGNANQIRPSFLVEERLEYLIIGDIITDSIPSQEIQEWIQEYGNLLKKNNNNIKFFSGFYFKLADTKTQANWINFIQDNIKFELIYPPVLGLLIDNNDLLLEIGVLEVFNMYSNDLIKYICNIN